MAIEFIACDFDSYGLNYGAPNGYQYNVQENDFVLLHIVGSQYAPVPPSSGDINLSSWTLISEAVSEQSWQYPVRYSGLYYAWVTAGASYYYLGGSWSYNNAGASNGTGSYATWMTFRGVNTTTPIGGSATTRRRDSDPHDTSNYWKTPAITLTNTSGTSAICHFIVPNNPNDIPNYATGWAVPSGYTARKTDNWDGRDVLAFTKDDTTSDGEVVFNIYGSPIVAYSAASVELIQAVVQHDISAPLTVTATGFSALPGASGNSSPFFSMFG